MKRKLSKFLFSIVTVVFASVLAVPTLAFADDYVAQVDGAKYQSLKEALNACTNGEIVKLIADIEYDADDVVFAHGGATGFGNYDQYNPSIIYLGGTKGATAAENQPSKVDAVLDLNGHTITNKADAHLFLIMDNAKLIFKDSAGGGALVSNTIYYPAIWSVGAETLVTIESGEYQTASATGLLHCTHSGDMVITGGEFSTTADDASLLLVLNTNKFKNPNYFLDGQATLTVKGGTFHGFNPAMTKDDSTVPFTEFNSVAEGYEVFDNGNGSWTVADDYVTWVKARLLAGNDVKLDRDIVVDGTDIESIPAPTNGNGKYPNYAIFTVIGDEVTFDLNGHTITYNGHKDFAWNNRTYNSCTVAHGLFYANAGADLTVIDSSEDQSGTVMVYGLASGAYVASPDTVFTIEGGKWINAGCKECGGTNIFLYPLQGGELYIKGGYFEQALDADGDSYLIVEHGGEYKNAVIDYSKTKIEVSGGTFKGMNPEEAKYFQQTADNKLVTEHDSINVVAPGYYAAYNGDGAWIVRPIPYIPPAETLPETGCGPDAACNVFDDVDAGSWYHEYFDWAYAQNVVRGYDDGSNNAGPEDETTRAQVMTMLYRMAGEPAAAEDPGFNDVKKGAWYYEEVAWAKSVGLVTGYLDGSGDFGPDDVMTREQMATVLYRFAQLEGCDVSVGEDTNILSYADALEIGEYAVPAMQWAVGTGIISGYDDDSNCLGPKDGAERGHFAAMLMRMDAAYEIL